MNLTWNHLIVFAYHFDAKNCDLFIAGLIMTAGLPVPLFSRGGGGKSTVAPGTSNQERVWEELMGFNRNTVNGTRERILLIDNIPENRRLMESMFFEEGYDIVVINDLSIEVADIMEKEPNLVVMDLAGPRADYFGLCRSISENDGVPVIFIADEIDRRLLPRIYESGGADYVLRPFPDMVLKARIETWIELKRMADTLMNMDRLLKEKDAKIKYLTGEVGEKERKDLLTGLSNRKEFIEKLETEVIRFQRSDIPFALVLCDMDDFKKINEGYGYDCGDFVLIYVADLLVSNARKQDITARWEGERFVLLLPETDLAGGKMLAEKVRKELNGRTFHYRQFQLPISMTFGVTVFSESKTIEQLIKSAEIALDKGKRLGKNSVVLSTVSS